MSVASVPRELCECRRHRRCRIESDVLRYNYRPLYRTPVLARYAPTRPCRNAERHPRLGKWMLPGGHVEPDENPAEAALREVAEETGLAARLLPGPRLDEPDGADEPSVIAPLWIVEQHVPAERREPEPHVHVDHLYLAQSYR